ncbi:MAG: hypothetical protein N2112_03875 [Gemmataceae bacterium]|jgi:hypothetical protein|nr:hypothetical protein [Gemmataceae bacterium]
MRNLFALIGLATVAFLGAGWYLGWYKISAEKSPTGTQNINVSLDTGKITSDVQTGVKQGAEVGGEFVNKLKDMKQDKPAPMTVPQGPASRFFSPEDNNGWKPLGSIKTDR